MSAEETGLAREREGLSTCIQYSGSCFGLSLGTPEVVLFTSVTFPTWPHVKRLRRRSRRVRPTHPIASRFLLVFKPIPENRAILSRRIRSAGAHAWFTPCGFRRCFGKGRRGGRSSPRSKQAVALTVVAPRPPVR